MIFFPLKRERKIVNVDNNKINTLRYLNRPLIMKEKYEPVIPLNLFTCWHTKDLPQLMRENYEKIKGNHPNFNHYLYDEYECENFIKDNFEIDVLNAYKSLIPSSYKSDLWRYCILYINGGIYFDIKFGCVNNFNFITLTENEHFVRDRELWGGTLTGLIAVKPRNKILFNCIMDIDLNKLKNIMAIYGEKEKFIYNTISSFNLLLIILYLSFSKLLISRLQGVHV